MQENIRNISFKTFAKLCYYPDQELADLLFDDVITRFLSALEIENSNINQLTSWLKTFKSKEELLETLQVEYTHLFITSFPSLHAPMFKSFYYENEILGMSTEKVMDIYDKFNFHVSDDMAEPPDNLAIMLEFVYRLSELENTYEDQISFVKNEILSWIEQLEEKINEAAEIPFYPFIINTIIHYLKNDVTQYEIKLAGAKL
ncbi:chaperone protein TorD [bacterium BMS3Abin04]|nr:chaperone protein TorD [bacterium BMS3Abin04]